MAGFMDTFWGRTRRKQRKEGLMGVTNDRNDPGLGQGVNDTPVPQNAKYLVLADEERAKEWVRPYRDTYRHVACGATTTMGRELAETYAREPSFYGATYCCHCEQHRLVGEHGEFEWLDGEKVGT